VDGAVLLESFGLQPGAKKPVFAAVTRPVLAGFLASLLLFSLTVAASPSLHKCLHGDAADGNHLCAVCLLVNGQITAPNTVVLSAVLVLAIFFLLPRRELPLPGFVRDRLSPGRGPPSY